MNEAIPYALNNLEQTRDIHDLIYDMKQAVLKRVDNAIRNAVPGWYGDQCECDGRYSVHKDH